jgi:hypothetical protein
VRRGLLPGILPGAGGVGRTLKVCKHWQRQVVESVADALVTSVR